jgi:hypothetical protein
MFEDGNIAVGMVEMEVSVTFRVCFVHISKCFSTSSNVGSGCMSTASCDNVYLYRLKFALWKDMRGRIGVRMRLAEIVAITGIFSDCVICPGIGVPPPRDCGMPCYWCDDGLQTLIDVVALVSVMGESNCLLMQFGEEFLGVVYHAFDSGRR